DDIRITRMQERLAHARPVHLELRDGRRLETLHQGQITAGQPLERLLEGEFRGAAKLVLHRPTHGRGDQDFLAAGLTVPKRVLARLVEIEFVVRVLDQRHRQPSPGKPGNQLLDERRLAAARPARETEDSHRGQSWRSTELMNSPLAWV